MDVIHRLLDSLKNVIQSLEQQRVPNDWKVDATSVGDFIQEIKSAGTLHGLPLTLLGYGENRSTRTSSIGESSLESSISKAFDTIKSYVESLVGFIEKRYLPFPEWLIFSNEVFELNLMAVFYPCFYETSSMPDALRRLICEEGTSSEVNSNAIIQEYTTLYHRLSELRTFDCIIPATVEELWYTILTTESLYEGLLDLTQFALKIMTRSYNECIVEVMCKALTLHNQNDRPLNHDTLNQEVFVSNNGPVPWLADELLTDTLNCHFGGRKWHFCSSSNSKFGASKVVQKHMKQGRENNSPYF